MLHAQPPPALAVEQDVIHDYCGYRQEDLELHTLLYTTSRYRYLTTHQIFTCRGHLSCLACQAHTPLTNLSPPLIYCFQRYKSRFPPNAPPSGGQVSKGRFYIARLSVRVKPPLLTPELAYLYTFKRDNHDDLVVCPRPGLLPWAWGWWRIAHASTQNQNQNAYRLLGVSGVGPIVLYCTYQRCIYEEVVQIPMHPTWMFSC